MPNELLDPRKELENRSDTFIKWIEERFENYTIEIDALKEQLADQEQVISNFHSAEEGYDDLVERIRDVERGVRTFDEVLELVR